jgi:hypothetical protein
MPAVAMTREMGSLGWTPRRRRGESRRPTGVSGRAGDRGSLSTGGVALLYDFVIDTDTVDVMTAVGQVLGLIVGAGLGVGAGGHVRLASVVGSETVVWRPVR